MDRFVPLGGRDDGGGGGLGEPVFQVEAIVSRARQPSRRFSCNLQQEDCFDALQLPSARRVKRGTHQVVFRFQRSPSYGTPAVMTARDLLQGHPPHDRGGHPIQDVCVNALQIEESI